ncbi:MAG: ferritin-like domain-containing protein [Sedimentisphaerales bacterium]|nr:ferritin-like domain-containing protein [Sedimentisphaerales bacterium]
MSKVNSDMEILEFAISKEMEAHHFFLALSRRVKNQKIRDMLEHLAAEELEHRERLELEVMKLGKTVTTERKPPRPDSDYIMSDDALPLDMDYQDVLLLAMEKEEASFRTFVNLLPNVHDEESHELLLALAEEEVKHKLRFETEYNKLFEKS